MAGRKYSPAEKAAALARWHDARKRGIRSDDAIAAAGVPMTTLRQWLRGGQKRTPRQGIKRPCLCCGGTFVSEGPGNRLCDPCRVTIAGLPPAWSA